MALGRWLVVRNFSAAALLFAGACAPVTRITPPTGVLITRLGADTIQIEQYTRTANALVGRALTRTPRTVLRDFTYRYNPDGTIARLEYFTRRIDSLGVPPIARTVITFVNDSAYTEGLDPNVATRRAARPTHVAWSGIPPFSIVEAAAQRAPAAVGDSVVLNSYLAGLGSDWPFVVKRTAPDSITMWMFHIGTVRADLPAGGWARSFDGIGSSINYTVTRADNVQLDSLARVFFARDAATGGGLGAVSPRDTARGTVHGATITIDYGRPSARGRAIFGEGLAFVVPWNRVWRTGANLATHVSFDRDVVLGGLTVPAGNYTLWTIPRADEWELIISRQTRQWGTIYDPAQDLGRTRMQVRQLATPVEQLTIAIEPRDVAGVLKISWDRTEASVPFSGR